MKVAMITGDAQQVAHAVGQDLGIDEVFAEVLPQDKDTKVTQLQERGLSVAMVGDGVNDAPALARAEVGIAIGAGTDVAMESAGVVLASDDPRAILSMIELSQASYRKMIQNLIWASGYNILSVPLAAGVLAPRLLRHPPPSADPPLLSTTSATSTATTTAETTETTMATSETDGEISADYNDADIMFAQMMIPHHQQTVEMSEMFLAKEGIPAQVVVRTVNF